MGEGNGEVRYCVTLKMGSNLEEKQYFFAPRETIQRIFDSCKFQSQKNILWMGHVARISDKIYDSNAEIYFERGDLGSLEIITHGETLADAKKAANLCAKYWKISAPFLDFKQL